MADREKIRATEAAENAKAIARAQREGRNITFVASDGCEVTVTPRGYVFYNAADWY